MAWGDVGHADASCAAWDACINAVDESHLLARVRGLLNPAVLHSVVHCWQHRRCLHHFINNSNEILVWQRHAVRLFFRFSHKSAALQDDPDGANNAPSRKAWVNQLTVIKEVDFQRYVASRHVTALIDPAVCVPLPHGRDKWDLMAADMIADPELDNWPTKGVKDVEQSVLWATWTPNQQSWFKFTFASRFGWAFYFGTVQVCPHTYASDQMCKHACCLFQTKQQIVQQLLFAALATAVAVEACLLPVINNCCNLAEASTCMNLIRHHSKDMVHLCLVQYDKIELWRPWVLTTIATSAIFFCGCFAYGVVSGTKKGDAALQPCT